MIYHSINLLTIWQLHQLQKNTTIL